MLVEIERKYLISDPPEGLYALPSTSIEQGYIVVTADDELRIRKRDHSFKLTFKRGSGAVRHEVEVDVSEEQYEEFKPLIIGSTIRKKRIALPYMDHTIEIDVYKDALEGLLVAEVEFASKQTMRAFSPPAWFGEEVSARGEFKNKALAMKGLPASLLRAWKEGPRPGWHYRQSGVVPFREVDEGYEVLLITTRKGGRWMLPKGIIEPDLSAADSARKEALEEAGVRGNVIAGVQDSYDRNKWKGRCHIILFPLRVTESLPRWAEDEARKREWVRAERVENYIDSQDLRRAILNIMDGVRAATQK